MATKAKNPERTLTNFAVQGPFDVPVKRDKGGRIINQNGLKTFWKKEARTGQRIGCYVFAIRAGQGGIAPWYVGKTRKGFAQECFTPHKITKYQEALTRYKAGTALLFLLVAPKGKAAIRKIADLERYLIETAWAANPDLLNQRGKKERTWTIRGITKSAGQGATSAPVKALRKALRLQAPRAKPVES